MYVQYVYVYIYYWPPKATLKDLFFASTHTHAFIIFLIEFST